LEENSDQETKIPKIKLLPIVNKQSTNTIIEDREWSIIIAWQVYPGHSIFDPFQVGSDQYSVRREDMKIASPGSTDSNAAIST